MGRVLRFKESLSVPMLFELWHDPTLRSQEVARRLGCSVPTLWRLKAIYGLPKRENPSRATEDDSGWRKADPTEEEIEQRAAEVRLNWSQNEERKRRSADSLAEVVFTPSVSSKDMFGPAGYP
jgi:predicted DNA-binding transcriptional regulator AlpA